jgi:GGDEF domain-containing protein
MALIDVDEFSTINDLFGEKIGDTILYEFASKNKKLF